MESTSTFGKVKCDPSDVEDIRTYFDLFKEDANALTDELYDDLDIEELFAYSNRCITSMGEMLLYYKMRHLIRRNSVADSEETIGRIEKDSEFREKIEDALLRSANRKNGSASGLLGMSIHFSKWHPYFRFFPIIYILLLVCLWLLTSPAIVLAGCAVILGLNIFIHYWNKRYVETYIRPLNQLNRIRVAALKLSRIDKHDSLADVSESIRKLTGLGKKVSLFGLNRVVESEFVIVFFMLTEFAKILFLIEPIVTHRILSKMHDVNQHSKRLIDYLGEWDVLYSVSSLRVWMKENDLSWSAPTFTRLNGSLRADGIYHPLIAGCVPNSIRIDRSVVITGSNMSGKSSFLKTIGVNIVASYALNTCFAVKFDLPDCNLHTVLSVSDDINNAKSYYFSEARRVKSIIDRCNRARSGGTDIVIIDEIFKGTNTIERISIAHAVIKYFAKLENTIIIVSTHDIELARSFEGVLDTYHFSEEMERGQPVFSYKLIPGIEYTRNAISILRNCGYPEEIILDSERNSRIVCKNMDSVSL